MRKIFLVTILAILLLAITAQPVYAADVHVDVWSGGCGIAPGSVTVGDCETVTWTSETTIFVPLAAEIEIDVPAGGPFAGGFKKRVSIGTPITSPHISWPEGVDHIKYSIRIYNVDGKLIRDIDPYLLSPEFNGGCFIATAAYGTSTAEEIDTLRDFRDEVLLQNSLGSQLVNLYYEVSPPVADFISEHDGLRTLVRELFVDPVAWLVEATEAIWGD